MATFKLSSLLLLFGFVLFVEEFPFDFVYVCKTGGFKINKLLFKIFLLLVQIDKFAFGE